MPLPSKQTTAYALAFCALHNSVVLMSNRCKVLNVTSLPLIVQATSSNSSTLAPTAENADAALTPSMAAAAAASNDLGFTGAEDRQLWDSVSRALLKLGKSGLADSHVNSLKELLVAHLLVKVELNGARSDVDVTAAAEEMATRLQGIGRVLQV